MSCSETAVRVSSEMQRTLRSSPRNKQNDELEEEVALEKAEEKLMQEDEDEEIESCDESGKPVVDTEKLERRMMTVALVNSVVEHQPSSGNSTKESQDTDKKHTYGLRKRSSKTSRDSSDDEERPQTRRRRTQPLKKRSVASALSAPPVLPKESVVGNSSGTAATAGPQGMQSTQQVPNPLLQQVHETSQLSAQARAASTLHPVPCPLPAGGESSREASIPDAASSAQVVMKANETGATRRGRIFSIDIDREF